jgi:hypothetical protein
MEQNARHNIQQKLSSLKVPYDSELHNFKNVPSNFKPWTCDLSPSALYNCSLSCRKKLKIKTPEVKWMSIKRWVTVTPSNFCLPEGVFYSVKRREEFITEPKPHFAKREYAILMMPYGNVFPSLEDGNPITDEWLFSERLGKLNIEYLIEHDVKNPLREYFQLCHDYMASNPDQIGIHLKRQKNANDKSLSKK